MFNICLDNLPIEGDSRITVFPHYRLQVVYLKPELIGAFETFEITCEFLMYSYWDQGELEAVHITCSDRKPQKVVQIPRVSHVWEFNRRNPDIGFIVVDGRHVGYFLRKKEALALEKMVLEQARRNSISYSNGKTYGNGQVVCLI